MTALEKKTVILVTHQVEFLAAVDRILVRECTSICQHRLLFYQHMIPVF